MARGNFRDDLALAAYAVSLGFTLRGHHDSDIAVTAFDYGGIPPDGLQFKIGDMDVWSTARGWRVGRLVVKDGSAVYERPANSDFYPKLKDALDEAARNWRVR